MTSGTINQQNDGLTVAFAAAVVINWGRAPIFLVSIHTQLSIHPLEALKPVFWLTGEGKLVVEGGLVSVPRKKCEHSHLQPTPK